MLAAAAHPANQVFFWGWTIGSLIVIAAIWLLDRRAEKRRHNR